MELTQLLLSPLTVLGVSESPDNARLNQSWLLGFPYYDEALISGPEDMQVVPGSEPLFWGIRFPDTSRRERILDLVRSGLLREVPAPVSTGMDSVPATLRTFYQVTDSARRDAYSQPGADAPYRPGDLVQITTMPEDWMARLYSPWAYDAPFLGAIPTVLASPAPGEIWYTVASFSTNGDVVWSARFAVEELRLHLSQERAAALGLKSTLLP